MRILAHFMVACTFWLALSSLAWSAPTLTTSSPCYVYTGKISFKATGFPADTSVDIYSYFLEEGQPEPGPNSFSLDGSLKTGPGGIVEGELRAPNSGNTGRSGTFLLDLRAGTERASVRLKIVPIAVTPEIVGYEDTNGFVNLKVSGFMGFDNLYAHYILQLPGKPNRELHTIKVGALDKSYGGLQMKYKKFPFKPIPKGGYWIQFDGYEKYTPLNDNASTPEKPYVMFNTSVVQ